MLGILGVMLGTFVMKPLDYDFSYSPVEESTTEQIEHVGYSTDDYRQAIVQRAYELGGMDFVIMIECESGFNPNAIGDNGHAHGLCQMSDLYHKIPKEYFEDPYSQLDYCFTKRKSGTRFYGPSRIIKGQKCYNYVSNRFILNN